MLQGRKTWGTDARDDLSVACQIYDLSLERTGVTAKGAEESHQELSIV